MDIFRIEDFPEKTEDWLREQAENGHIWILGGIDERELAFLLPLLSTAGKRKGGTTIHVDSSGGCCILYEYMRELCPNIVKTIAYEICESTALSIFALGKERACRPYTRFMHHQSNAGRDGGYKSTEAKNLHDWTAELDLEVCRRLAAVSTRTVGWWKFKSEHGKEFAFLGTEAKNIGVATKLV